VRVQGPFIRPRRLTVLCRNRVPPLPPKAKSSGGFGGPPHDDGSPVRLTMEVWLDFPFVTMPVFVVSK
jgi:hypothetical protein